MIFHWFSVSFRYAVNLRDDLMFSLCCFRTKDCKELLLNGGILAGCKFAVMKFCLVNKEIELRARNYNASLKLR